MIRSLHSLPIGLVLSAILVAAAGCGSTEKPAGVKTPPPAPAPAHDHDHGHADHVHPKTLEEGLGELQSAITTISTSLATGAKDTADTAVHEVGHLLEDLEGLIEKQEWTVEVKETGRKALAELTESFDKLDQSLHAAEGEGETPAAVLGSVTERIGNAVVSLGELIKSSTSSANETSKEEN